jgi:outer membrane protein OmpA-like peptidoglycan-associated protein
VSGSWSACSARPKLDSEIRNFFGSRFSRDLNIARARQERLFALQEELVGNARKQLSPVAEHVASVTRPVPHAELLRPVAPRTYGGNQAALRRFAFNSQRIQCKLEVGATNDPLEAEADQVADRVMRMTDASVAARDSAPIVRRACPACQKEEEGDKVQRKESSSVVRRMCPECKKEEEEKEQSVQRKAATVGSSGGPAPQSVKKVLNSPGRPLPASDRAFFEPRLGVDLSSVRIHDDSRAADSARSIGAHAYTLGSHVAFAGPMDASSDSGRRLLAHELAHVAQQQGGAGSCLRRLGNLSQVPASLSCPVASHGAPQPTEVFLFDNNSATLSPTAKARIAAFADNWRAAGQGLNVRIDGFASEPGDDALNWRLSCDRAVGVKAELMNPSLSSMSGIPDAAIEVYMQGKTREFGSEAQNRRVSLFLPNFTQTPPSVPSTQQVAPVQPHSSAGPPRRPVYVCSKPLETLRYYFKHAFFRVGGPGPGNPTYELEPDEHACPCSLQGRPQRDVPEDRDSADAQCYPTPIDETVLASLWNRYPVGMYCVTGPNSNTYVRVVSAACGSMVRPPVGSVLGLGRPPFVLPGYDDSPPPAGGAGVGGTNWQLAFGCHGQPCDNTACEYKREREYERAILGSMLRGG